MSEHTQVLLVGLGVLAFLFILLLAAVVGFILFRLSSKFAVIVRDFIESMRILGAAAADFKSIPKHMEGQTKVSMALATEIEAFRKTVESFTKIVMKPDEGTNHLEVPTEDDANAQYIFEKLMNSRPDMTRQEARQLVPSITEEL